MYRDDVDDEMKNSNNEESDLETRMTMSAKEDERERIQEQINEYLNKGGNIDEVQSGLSAMINDDI
jgi:hypothetical protein